MPRVAFAFFFISNIFKCVTSTILEVKTITMPMLSSTMTEGVVSTWNVKVGDPVHLRSILLTVESDKAEMDVESFEEGYVAKLVVPAGDTAKVGAVIALLVNNLEDVEAVNKGAFVDNDGNIVFRPLDSQTSAPLPIQTAESLTTGVAAPTENTDSHFQSVAISGVDQDVRDQLPLGMTPKNLSNHLFDRIAANPTLAKQLENLSHSSKDGKTFIESMQHRAMYRAPPARILTTMFSREHQSDVPATERDMDVQQRAAVNNVASLAETIVQKQRIGTNQEIAPTRSGEVWVLHGKTPATIETDPLAITATPTARTLAKKMSVDISSVKGTGNFGRVTAEDVNLLAKQKQSTTTTLQNLPKPTADRRQPLTSLQSAIARSMAETVQTPVFRITKSVRVDMLKNLYSQLKSQGVTWTAIIAKAVAIVLSMQEYSVINASFDAATNSAIYHDVVNVAVAASSDGALYTPVLRDVANKSLYTVAKDWGSLVEKVNNKTVRPGDQTGATFYISNLGQFGVDQFDAILPKGAGAIMSIGSITPIVHPAMTDNGSVSQIYQMKVTLTCDHRHINGAEAASFLQAFAKVVEQERDKLAI